MFRILALNFGGTSSKVSIYEDDKCIHSDTLEYTKEELQLSSVAKIQLEIKKKQLLEWLDGVGVCVEDIDAFAVRLAGLFNGGNGGTFLVDGDLRKQVDLSYHPEKALPHATRLTMALVDEVQKGLEVKKPCYATDPSSSDAFLPEAKITGSPLFTKRVSFHALSQRAVAKKAAADLGKTYREVNLIVVHMGGGISIGAHEKGKVIDVNDASGSGDGPFSANRAGTLPTGPLVRLCYSGKYTEEEAYRLLVGNAGLKGYLGTEDLREVEKRIDEGDKHAELIFKALAYQISREIGSCYATLRCNADAVVFTAGMSKSERLIDLIRNRVGKVAPIICCYPGDFENEALALGAYRVLSGQEELAVYKGECGNAQSYFPGRS